MYTPIYSGDARGSDSTMVKLRDKPTTIVVYRYILKYIYILNV